MHLPKAFQEAKAVFMINPLNHLSFKLNLDTFPRYMCKQWNVTDFISKSYSSIKVIEINQMILSRQNVFPGNYLLFLILRGSIELSIRTGGGNDALNADAGKSIKLLKFIAHGVVLSKV